MIVTEIFQRMNSHRKCQGHATKTLPERKDTGKDLPSKTHLTIYLVWTVRFLNDRKFFSLFILLHLFKTEQIITVIFFFWC